MIAIRRTMVVSAVLLITSLAACAQDNATQAIKPMAKDADPSFEVAVIKPTDPNDRNAGFHLDGRRVSIENMTMTNMICFAYTMEKSQIINAPAWFDEQHWDIDGVPDAEGKPSWKQYQRMLRKVLAARFGLQMHPDKRELSVFTLTVAKGGAKIEKSKSDPDANSDSTGHGQGSAQYMKFTNVSMADFAQTLELMGANKPVLDQTNLAGRFDFTLTWTPDAIRATAPNAPPALFTAVQEQLGLKLEAARAPADVLVVDAATKPTEN